MNKTKMKSQRIRQKTTKNRNMKKNEKSNKEENEQFDKEEDKEKDGGVGDGEFTDSRTVVHLNIEPPSCTGLHHRTTRPEHGLDSWTVSASLL